MSGIWGNNIRYSIFGESHGKGIGIVIDGLPAGITLDFEEIRFEMDRRRPGKNKLTTSRRESDEFEILSGYFNERTTGTPLCTIIRNHNQRSKDYEKLKNLMRPGHADYTGHMRYKGYNDYRGGGYFSGRLTAPLVFAGAIAKQILKEKNIIIGSHIYKIGDINDLGLNKVKIDEKLLEDLRKQEFPVLDEKKKALMKNKILEVKREGDSLGGVVEGAIINIPPGLGTPYFGSIESKLASLLFSIPAVKGVGFGAGFNISEMKGSQANDEYYIENNIVKTYTNNNGGILGGITNGMPIIFRAVFKPTPSILKQQRTIDISKMENRKIKIEGRHDPCIVPRAVPVVEAVAAMAILDEVI